MTDDGGGAAVAGDPEEPKPPFAAWLWDRTYSQARWMRGVGRIGAELVQEDQLQTVPRYLRRVARSRLLPIALRMLGGEDRRDGVGGHRRPAAATTSGVIGRSVEQLAQREMPDGRVRRLQQPVQRVRAEGGLAILGHRSLPGDRQRRAAIRSLLTRIEPVGWDSPTASGSPGSS